MVHYINGNLLDTDAKYICHQVNCQGVMGSGVAKAIRNKWPVVYESYVEWYEDSLGMFGKILIVPVDSNRAVVNMAAQMTYGSDGKRYTSYEAFYNCLAAIDKKLSHGSSIAFPDHIGCGLGGANWNIVKTMIEEVLGENYEVYIYKYGGK